MYEDTEVRQRAAEATGGRDVSADEALRMAGDRERSHSTGAPWESLFSLSVSGSMRLAGILKKNNRRDCLKERERHWLCHKSEWVSQPRNR